MAPSVSAARPSARAQADRRKRGRLWVAAGKGAVKAGVPLTVHITLTWSALLCGERAPGHCLHLPERARTKKLWDSLWRLLSQRHGHPFVVASAPEYDARKGLHLHLAAHVPEHLLRDVAKLVERLTGAPAEFYRAPGSRDYERAPKAQRSRGWVARSACGGWLLQWNYRPADGGCSHLLPYVTKALPQAQVREQYRLSNALSALGRRELSGLEERASPACPPEAA